MKQYLDDQGQKIDADAFAKEINADTSAAPNKEELEREIASHYHQTLTHQLASFSSNAALAGDIMPASAASFLHLGGGILGKIQKFVCKIISSSSTIPDIIDAVFQALASILPGGAILRAIAKKIVKYILQLGVSKFCPVN